MRHGKKSKSPQPHEQLRIVDALLSNMASSLILRKENHYHGGQGEIELRKYVEPLITKAKDDTPSIRAGL